jgi:acyl dehydratase
MTSTSVRFDSSAIGKWTEPDTFEVTRERIAAYAEATNDPIAAHRAGDIAPPVFAIVPSFMSVMQVAFLVAPPEAAMRVVHGEQDFRLHRPIVPGDVISTRATPIGYSGAANGTSAAFLLECRDAAGEIVNEQYMTAFFRGVDAGETVGELAPAHKFDERLRDAEPVAVVTQHVDEDQTFRYSPASGDPMPIHLDEDTARAAGLPGCQASSRTACAPRRSRRGRCSPRSRAASRRGCGGTPCVSPSPSCPGRTSRRASGRRGRAATRSRPRSATPSWSRTAWPRSPSDGFMRRVTDGEDQRRRIRRL